MAEARPIRRVESSRLNTPTDLDPGDTRKIAEGLAVLTSDLFALYIKTKNFHWHMNGPNFRDDHLLLDEQGDQIFGIIDSSGSSTTWPSAPARSAGPPCAPSDRRAS